MMAARIRGMGVWGTALFSNDVACDIRDHYRELIEDGVDDAEATRQIMTRYQASFDDPDDGTSAILALAITQSKIGRLDPVIRDRAVAAIDGGGDLSVWAVDNPKQLGKRKAALVKAREQLTGPQPARKRLKRPSRDICDLVAGDVLALDLPGGPVLIRTVYVRSHRRGESPTLEELAFTGTEVPHTEIIRQLPSKVENEIIFANPFCANPARFGAMRDGTKAGWKEAGFRKVANIPARAGDEIPGDSGCGFSWWGLAEAYRNHRADPATRCSQSTDTLLE